MLSRRVSPAGHSGLACTLLLWLLSTHELAPVAGSPHAGENGTTREEALFAHGTAWLHAAILGDPAYRTGGAAARLELTAFNSSCSWLGPALASNALLYSNLSRVLVFDGRHTLWPGLGDSLSNWIPLLRLGRALGRATFLWLGDETCGAGEASHSIEPPPPPIQEGSVRRGCGIDGGVFFNHLGGATWRWTARTRADVVAAQGGGDNELFLIWQCHGEEKIYDQTNASQSMCTNATLIHGGNGTMYSAASNLSGVWSMLHGMRAPWVRLKLRFVEDLHSLAVSMTACNAASVRPPFVPEHAVACAVHNCEFFAATRPTPRTLAALRPYLHVLDNTSTALVAVVLRTGVADHASRFPDLEARARARATAFGSVDALQAAIAPMFEPCPPQARRVWREAANGSSPCVSWHDKAWVPGEKPLFPDKRVAAACGIGDASIAAEVLSNGSHALPPLLFPDMAGSGPLGAVMECAAQVGARISRQLARDSDAGGQPRYLVFVTSDAPALKCLAEAGPLGRAGVAMITPSRLGHVQYVWAGDSFEEARRKMRALTPAAVVDYYILGLSHVILAPFLSAFVNVARRRSFVDGRMGGTVLPSGYEQWFSAGREANMPHDRVNASLVELLSATLPGACPRAALNQD